MTDIVKGRYKDQDAVVLENGDVRAVFLPHCGSKLASFVHKATGTEVLWQNPEPRYRRTFYGDAYGKGEFSGMDEMFPSISACRYESGPWSGVEVPDHGEVWSLPWQHSIEGSSLVMRVSGLRFPYFLEKEVRLEGSCLRSHYRLSSGSDFPLEYIWAAHPLFNAVEGTEFIVPAGMDRVINAVPGAALPNYGESLGFPVAEPRGAKPLRLDRMPGKDVSSYQKYWFADKVTEGWCMLHDPISSLTVGLAWPRERVPFLGMWLNAGGWDGQFNIAPEPASAAMDRIDLSRLWGRGSVLEPQSRQEWDLAINLTRGEKPRGLGVDGGFQY
ncbi:MAG: hypothetical protein WCQ50_07355 [Spirochaetota bacterium]